MEINIPSNVFIELNNLFKVSTVDIEVSDYQLQDSEIIANIRISGDYYQNFCLEDVTTAYENNEFFTTNKDDVNSNPVSGATYSANAVINAVNCVIKHIGLTYEKGVQNG